MKSTLSKVGPFEIKKIQQLYELFHRYDHELGFVPRSQIIECAEKGELLAVEVNGCVVAGMLYHIRRDLGATVYSVAVEHTFRNRGFGRMLLKYVTDQGFVVRLKCPKSLMSNGFYKKIGTSAGTGLSPSNTELIIYEISAATITKESIWQPLFEPKWN